MVHSIRPTSYSPFKKTRSKNSNLFDQYSDHSENLIKSLLILFYDFCKKLIGVMTECKKAIGEMRARYFLFLLGANAVEMTSIAKRVSSDTAASKLAGLLILSSRLLPCL